MLDSAAPDDQRTKVLANVEKIVAGGEIVSKQDWGTPDLAYEIRHKAEAEYHLLQFHGPATLLDELHRMLHITDGVVRFRIIKLAPGTPAPADAAARRRPRRGRRAGRGARRRISAELRNKSAERAVSLRKLPDARQTRRRIPPPH